ncbi:hypothetical protein MHC_03540 [Mycoplasma haemocanis str. Illinois]|uniref:Uncharacterized protein n=1 Tax=Mycoplasma haemocanis (strain Illinois) TaxID=1111676 RepID=H6N7E6_MYCHN|nr:hypothetical protein [Mycoplasma haemocanis]AEW45568.1 hypothetical protein MHC_03540 [Mycoplasma haemocanis str. Illinois]
MPISVAKISLGVVGVSTASVGGIYLSGVFNTTNKLSIKDLITKNKLIVPIKSGENNRWNKIWEKYKTHNNGKEKDSWNLQGWNHTNTTTRLSSLENKCSSEISETISGEEDPKYKDFVSWCTRKAEFKDQLSDMGYEPLSEGDSLWTSNFDSYKAAENQTKIHGVDIQTSDTHTSNLDKFKTGCATALSKEIDDENYSKTFEGIKRWCTKKKNN